MSAYQTKVLLVEDELDAREILEFYLSNVFDEVIVANNGEDGFDICKKLKSHDKYFDIIITDIKMPKKDGFSMIEDIRSILPNQKYIIISAHKDEEYLFKSINLDIISYFVKPLDIDNIMKILKTTKENIIDNKKEKRKLLRINKTYSYCLSKKMLYKGKTSVKFSKKEFALIEILIENINYITNKDDIKKHIWDTLEVSDATMRTVIKRVKDRIKDDDFIISRKGYGYLIETK